MFAHMIPEKYEASSILYISANKIKTILENYVSVENNTSVRLQTNCRKTNEIWNNGHIFEACKSFSVHSNCQEHVFFQKKEYNEAEDPKWPL